MDGDFQASQPSPTHFVLRRLIVAGLLCIGILLILVLSSGYWTLFRPVALVKPETVIIGRDASFGYVARRLQERQLIPNAFAFKAYARFTNVAHQLKVGEYEVTTGMRPVDILRLFVSGHAKAFSITIPEGKWASEIGPMLTTHWPDATHEFAALTQQPQRWVEKHPYLQSESSLEGYLFPDTYRFHAGANATQIIEAMLQRFETTCLAAYRQTPPRDGRSLHDVLVLASLVEAEAKVDAERPIIAGVYLKRLRARTWTLDCDATLIYAKGTRVTRVLYEDKLIDSPYNSYKRRSLPPGPINNPGLKSFRAALNPADVEYYFYVAKGDGTHIFSRTLQEQSDAIRRVQGK